MNHLIFVLFTVDKMYNIPSEVWEEILHKVEHAKELKNVSLVCRLFYNIVKEQLWNTPKLKSGMCVEDLLTLKHLPIKSINTGDFGKLTGERRGDNTEKWMEVICSFSQLTSLKLGWNLHLTHAYIGIVFKFFQFLCSFKRKNISYI